MRESPPTVIAAASGKGGTGKTTVAAHLALASSRSRATLLVDLDVEAPDVLGFFPEARSAGEVLPVTVKVPRLAADRCLGCGRCAKSCRFGAIVALGKVVTVDERVCKGCGRCVAACPARALDEGEVAVGGIEMSRQGDIGILEGRVRVGDIRSTAVIEAAKRAAAAEPRAVEIRDCPPGVSCPASHAIEGADFVVLVAEPTEFSLHDLGAAIELVRSRGIPAGVLVNKDGFGTADIDGFCAERGMPVIGRIAFNRERASSGAAGRLWKEDPIFSREMDEVLGMILDRIRVSGGDRE